MENEILTRMNGLERKMDLIAGCLSVIMQNQSVLLKKHGEERLSDATYAIANKLHKTFIEEV